MRSGWRKAPVAQSYWIYAPGPGLAGESDPVDVDSPVSWRRRVGAGGAGGVVSGVRQQQRHQLAGSAQPVHVPAGAATTTTATTPARLSRRAEPRSRRRAPPEHAAAAS